eukprot:SAG31_NODE_4945_length_2843_cov_1.830904_1_plen_149_part_00
MFTLSFGCSLGPSVFPRCHGGQQCDRRQAAGAACPTGASPRALVAARLLPIRSQRLDYVTCTYRRLTTGPCSKTSRYGSMKRAKLLLLLKAARSAARKILWTVHMEIFPLDSASAATRLWPTASTSGVRPDSLPALRIRSDHDACAAV